MNGDAKCVLTKQGASACASASANTSASVSVYLQNKLLVLVPVQVCTYQASCCLTRFVSNARRVDL